MQELNILCSESAILRKYLHLGFIAVSTVRTGLPGIPCFTFTKDCSLFLPWVCQNEEGYQFHEFETVIKRVPLGATS